MGERGWRAVGAEDDGGVGTGMGALGDGGYV